MLWALGEAPSSCPPSLQPQCSWIPTWLWNSTSSLLQGGFLFTSGTSGVYELAPGHSLHFQLQLNEKSFPALFFQLQLELNGKSFPSTESAVGFDLLRNSTFQPQMENSTRIEAAVTSKERLNTSMSVPGTCHSPAGAFGKDKGNFQEGLHGHFQVISPAVNTQHGSRRKYLCWTRV